MLEPQDFKTSVVAVPPIALTADLGIAAVANQTLARHISAGGVSILLYGGNANLYHFGLQRYAEALAMMADIATANTHVITSIGPDFGKMLEQAPLVERSGIRNVMLLPVAFPSDPTGVANGVRRIADRLGFGVILYLKRENYVAPDALATLVSERAVRFVKYAVERSDPANDPYLDAVISAIGRGLLASGMGETPIADHIGKRHLATFTSGAVCIAPEASSRLLALYRAGQWAEALAAAKPFLEFERVRARLGGIQVLHSAIGAAGIADMGPLMPMLSVVDTRNMDGVRRSVEALLAAEKVAHVEPVAG
jgi:dihydrodipicolinate synthase/N-acetylneuraminate lyase